MHLTSEQRTVGKENFYAAAGSKVTQEFTRRDFLKGTAATTLVTAGSLGAAWFGYDNKFGDRGRLRVGIIGAGDEGNVLIGALNPEYIDVVAIADIRPYNVFRAFHGEEGVAVRPGLMKVYGFKSEEKAKEHVKVYGDYRELLKNPDVEAVIVALPLFIHHTAAIDAMKAGKHVLTEKLMAHSVHQCKEMARMSFETGKILATGHQRHYSILYENAKDMIRMGLLGYIHHIRAQWHRDHLPGKDSWQQALPSELLETQNKHKKELELIRDDLKFAGASSTGKGLKKNLEDRKAAVEKALTIVERKLDDQNVKAKNYGYEDLTLPNGYKRSALEELIRWRLWNRTGGGLMAELGSHQLDAAGIFLTAMRENDKDKALPLSVSAVGGRHVFPLDRDCDDHVYCTFEFAGPGVDRFAYFDKRLDKLAKEKNTESKIVVTYSSINGNSFGGYGEVVMGTKSTLILEKEEEVMLIPEGGAKTNVKVTKGKDGPTLDTTQSGAADAAAGKKLLDTGGPPSRGYQEEIEHFAYCVRHFNESDFKKDPDHYEPQPRCRPKVALGDAVIALTSNIAIKEGRRINFDPDWFKIESDKTPENVDPDVKQYA